MSSPVQKTRNVNFSLFVYVSILLLLLLSSNNINNYLSSKKVLGISSEIVNEVDTNSTFWKNFLSKNPNYAPGWEEIGRADKVLEIDPNFEFKVEK